MKFNWLEKPCDESQQGKIKFIIQNEDDLWIIYNILQPGDTITTSI